MRIHAHRALGAPQHHTILTTLRSVTTRQSLFNHGNKSYLCKINTSKAHPPSQSPSPPEHHATNRPQPITSQAGSQTGLTNRS